jgi:hypothetical protein
MYETKETDIRTIQQQQQQETRPWHDVVVVVSTINKFLIVLPFPPSNRNLVNRGKKKRCPCRHPHHNYQLDVNIICLCDGPQCSNAGPPNNHVRNVVQSIIVVRNLKKKNHWEDGHNKDCKPMFKKEKDLVSTSFAAAKN